MEKNKFNLLWKKFRQGLFQIFSANILNKVVAILCNMVITRVLTKEEFGSWSYIINIYAYLSLINAFGLENAAFQFGAENRENKKEFAYYTYCLKRGLLIDLIIVLLGILYVSFVNLPLENVKYYLIAYIPMLILEYVMHILTTVLRCENRIKEYANTLNINTVLTAAGTCIGALNGIYGIIIGKYIAIIISLLLLIYLMRNDVKKFCKKNSLKNSSIKILWHFSIMACISSAMNSLLYLLDISLITSLIQSAEETAIYKVSTLAPNALSFIPSSVIVVILPDIIANNKNNMWLREHVKKYFFYMGIANIIISLIAIIFAPFIITLLCGAEYLQSVPTFRILIVGYAISSTFRSLSSNILFGLKKVNINMITSLISGGADILLNYILIKKAGIIGAASATVLSESIASIIAFGYMYNIIYKNRNGVSR